MGKKYLKKLDKILVANRGEIAIRIFRAATELKIRTVAIYTYEDRYSLHRYKADESYQIGEDNDPLKPYLNIEEIIAVAKRENVDAIHPGYGFLSENVDFARRCREEGIIFVGPEPEVMQELGDKVSAKRIADAAKVPTIPDSKAKLDSEETARKEAEKIGYPVILKAAAGGGGRGMRVVHSSEKIGNEFSDARGEAETAFGNGTIFIEKYIDSPKHIEVQIMADSYGNIVHLYERDCSVQRRFQKVVEIAPSLGLKEETKQKLYDYAVSICRFVNYNNVGTVEFLVDKDENIYFIEVNPRVQVEHTITEEITGVDIVRSQILIAKGHKLSDKVIYIRQQSDVKINGFAIQCRITTEDPSNGFKPNYGTISAYRHATGFGIRLDEGSAYEGMKISPFFDSLLVKVSAWGRTLKGASDRLQRTLQEFRIRGVQTNIGFVENVIKNETFYKGQATVKFIDNHPELTTVSYRRDRATRTLGYLASVTVNGNPDVKFLDKSKVFRTPKIPDFDKFAPYPQGTKDKLTALGREGFMDWLKKEKAIQFTDTTFRDAHQSLLATRVRTTDMLKVAESYAKNHPETFSMEVWGGATFDVCLRFLKESPWERLQKLREAMPNILLQMLLRGSNAVGYTAYPDNLIEKFIEKSWENGIDVFRIFDSLNWVEAMKVSIRTVRERTGALAEAAISYTGDILDKDNKKYSLQYYLDLAKQLEDEGAHILAIKDMAGLLTPFAAEKLITELKKSISIPLHLHTHDTSSIQSATYLKAIEAGVDVIDLAAASMSGLTSQPNFNSVASFMKHHERANAIDIEKLNQYSNYWEDVREMYYPFESELKAGTAEVYQHEIPGGQYSNLRPQARALGLESKFDEVKKNYAVANELFGGLVKVTPSSKVVGDMAIFMTSNSLTKEDVLKKGDSLAFPESVKSLFRGDLGQPKGGFPKKLQKMVLKGEKAYTEKPNKHLEPIDFEKELAIFEKQYGSQYDFNDFLSFKLYPQVFEAYYQFRERFGDVSILPTIPFFYGSKIGEEMLIELDKGKVLMVRLMYISEPDEDGICVASFELNGKVRRVKVRDLKYKVEKITNRKVNHESDKEIGAPLQGRISKILVESGDKVKENQALFVIEAMKMETTITASQKGQVSEVLLKAGSLVEQDDLVVVLK
ncbi:MAG: pyruvate carboxylase [Flammeovirgaceae bacterium]|jgi:pyruvate carboxylase